MWTRSELKERAKVAFKRNYWKCVLVALILAVLTGSNLRYNNDRHDQEAEQQVMTALEGMEGGTLKAAAEAAMKASSVLQNSPVTIAVGGLGLVGLVLGLLVFNPLIVGCRRFFLRNSLGNAELNELGAGFKDNWGNVVLTMFLKNLFIALWSLLLIVPGIIKAYSYRLVPYLLKDHPQLSGTEAITLSRKMMNGHKADAFVLDLSFLGWLLLSALTLGILHIFYVGPYVQATDAELYKAIAGAYASQNPVQGA